MAKRQLQKRPPQDQPPSLPADPPRQLRQLTLVERKLAILIGSALAVQIFVKYWGQTLEPLRWGLFYWGTAGARLAVPLLVCAALGISLRKLGLGRPQLSAREALWLLGTVAVATLVALPLLGMPSYQNAYYGISTFGISGWISFELSTVFTWELFYRGFVLFGVRELLRSAGRGAEADTIAILFTGCIEVLAHFAKEHWLEAVAMLFGSPALSWFALRHRSVWIPAAGHVWIELLWFMSVWR